MVSVDDTESIRLQIEQLEQKMEILRLKQQLAELQAQVASTSTAAAKMSDPVFQSVQQPEVVPEVTKALTSIAAAQTSESAIKSVQQPAVVTEIMKALPAAGSTSESESWMSAINPAINPPMGILFVIVLIPMSYFAFSKFVEFVETRYDEISSEREGEQSVPNVSPYADAMVAPPANVNLAVTRVTETKLYGRSAPDILFTGLTNLEKEPLGWLFGTPSALYSNLPAQQPTVLGPFVPEISNGFGDSPMVGRVVPTSTRISTTRVSPRSNAKKSRKSRKALGSRQL
eukprot:CAMPEP_0119315468 /NCGR_PEP_ID=MMETSP1333-20130426/36027_1 /TAXON_ID=418940 /ORGANISM="Scyphosphaera apsteinii, Strain RCC1455" /LENGTH=286 /DNA_ID=CAMNT_0007320839 /DNA_START=117 /DNA_END=977 /DNA_ORIENTATION=+